MTLVLLILASSCSDGAFTSPCDVLTGSDLAAVLGVEDVQTSESAASGVSQTCDYYVQVVPSSNDKDPLNKALDLDISDVATYARADRAAALRPGQSELNIPGVDRATIGIASGATELSMVRGNRTATLRFSVDGNASEEGRRKLDQLAKLVVMRWLDKDADVRG